MIRMRILIAVLSVALELHILFHRTRDAIPTGWFWIPDDGKVNRHNASGVLLRTK